MIIKCTRTDVWWVVTQHKNREVFTYAYVWPMVIYWLQDQIGLPVKPDLLKFVSLWRYKWSCDQPPKEKS